MEVADGIVRSKTLAWTSQATSSFSARTTMSAAAGPGMGEKSSVVQMIAPVRRGPPAVQKRITASTELEPDRHVTPHEVQPVGHGDDLGLGYDAL